jgi:hypothetical protein
MKVDLDLSRYQWSLVISAVSERLYFYKELVEREPYLFPIGANRELKKEFIALDQAIRYAVESAEKERLPT